MNNPNRLYWSKIVIWKLLTLAFCVWCVLGPYSPIWGNGKWNWDNMVEGKSGFLLFSVCGLILGFMFIWAGNGYMLKFAFGKDVLFGSTENETISSDNSYSGRLELFFGALFFLLLLIFSERLQHELLGSIPIVNILKLSSVLSVFILTSLFLSSRQILLRKPAWSTSKNIVANLLEITLIILIVLAVCTVITAFWYFSAKGVFVLYQNLYLSQQEEISREYGPGLSRSAPYGLLFWILVLVGMGFFVYTVLFLPTNISQRGLEKIQLSILSSPKT